MPSQAGQWSNCLKKLIGILLLACVTHAYAYSSNHQPTFAFADVLYWQMRASGADNWGQQAISGGGKTEFKVLDAPYEWNTGIRLGIGREFSEPQFDVVLAYTHYQSTASNQASGKVISSFDGNYFVNNLNGASLDIPYRAANIRYQFFFNDVDLYVGRHYQPDDHLSLHPYFGLKAASIDQKIYSNWIGPIPVSNFTAGSENLTNYFTGVGPAMGVDASWTVYTNATQSIDVLGNLVGGLLYGHTTMTDVYANDQPITITVYDDSINGASPMVGGLLGIAWNKQYAASQLKITLGYEAQIWFNQTQFYSLNMGKMNRSISLQGADLEFRYNF